MSASLVGSEMCIRDRAWLSARPWVLLRRSHWPRRPAPQWWLPPPLGPPPVSYTHLTLPTICSV
eukprot:11934699-Alexandrium_andersonii.AAC.1